MEKKILGKKIGMTQIFAENGEMLPVTVIEAGPCAVMQIKTADKEGYNAVQLGFGSIKEKNVSKALKGHFAKAGAENKRTVREFKVENTADYTLGATVTAEVFETGDVVDITGTSKGKGYQGVIKRHGKSRGPEAHGSGYHRGVGSMGSGTTPGRIPKNKKMPGQTGCDTITIQNLKVVKVDAERNLILVKGSIPGPKGCVVEVKKAVKS